MKNKNLTQLTPRQIAEYEMVHVNTVLSWIATGELKGRRLGHRTIRVKMSDYLDFLKNGTK
jgi:excisionase family DNA binding protein